MIRTLSTALVGLCVLSLAGCAASVPKTAEPIQKYCSMRNWEDRQCALPPSERGVCELHATTGDSELYLDWRNRPMPGSQYSPYNSTNTYYCDYCKIYHAVPLSGRHQHNAHCCETHSSYSYKNKYDCR